MSTNRFLSKNIYKTELINKLLINDTLKKTYILLSFVIAANFDLKGSVNKGTVSMPPALTIIEKS